MLLLSLLYLRAWCCDKVLPGLRVCALGQLCPARDAAPSEGCLLADRKGVVQRSPTPLLLVTLWVWRSSFVPALLLPPCNRERPRALVNNHIAETLLSAPNRLG